MLKFRECEAPRTCELVSLPLLSLSTISEQCLSHSHFLYALVAGIVQFIGHEDYLVGLRGWSFAAQV